MSYHAMMEESRGGRRAGAAAYLSAKVLWNFVRFPILAVMAVMEPIITGVFAALSALSFLVAFFFGLVVKPQHFPFWPMVGFSAGCALLILLYYLVMRLFTCALK